jgi:hypothetical protein
MRTKTTLLTAALVAAGALTSMAQSNVYSLNVVGYVNVPVVGNGYTLVANQLNVDGTNSISTVLATGVPDQAQYFSWNSSTHTFDPSVTFFAGPGGGWFDLTTGNPATNIVAPGSAFFIYNSGAAATVTLVGSVPVAPSTKPVTPGYGFYAVTPPVASDLDTNGFPAQDQMQYSTFSNAGGYSSALTFFAGPSGGWFDLNTGNQGFPTPAVGQGFLIYNPNVSGGTWTNTFVVQ